MSMMGCRGHVRQESVAEEVAQMNWGTFKPKLGEAIIAHLAPIQAKYNEVMQDPAILDKVQIARDKLVPLSALSPTHLQISTCSQGQRRPDRQ